LNGGVAQLVRARDS